VFADEARQRAGEIHLVAQSHKVFSSSAREGAAEKLRATVADRLGVA
jgi:hypothetical protein